MAKTSSAKPKSPSPVQSFLEFVEIHRDVPLKQAEEERLFALDLAACTYCAAKHINVPDFGGGDRTPGMKLNYGRESIYKYPGALSGELQIPDGEIAHFGICIDPQEDWLLWLRSVANAVVPASKPGTNKSPLKVLVEIQELDRIVLRKLREAMEHAVITWDRTGEPEIPPRCNQKDIGLELGLSESTTSRRFDRSEANELRAHWDRLADREWIMKTAENRRNSVGS